MKGTKASWFVGFLRQSPGSQVVTADAMGVAMRLKMNKGKSLGEMGDTYYVVDSATDMWAVGVVAWELFTGRPLFGDNFADEQVAAMLLGFRPLPFESDPSLWVLFRDAKVGFPSCAVLNR